MRTRYLSSSRMIVFARALLVALAAAAVVTGFAVTRKSPPKPTASGLRMLARISSSRATSAGSSSLRTPVTPVVET